MRQGYTATTKESGSNTESDIFELIVLARLEEIEKSASLLSLLTPQRKIKEFESKQSSIDKDLKDNLKMRSSILEDFNASLKSETSTQKNSSLSFGALYSYLFES